METFTKQEELEIRIANIQNVIKVLEMELLVLLQEYDKLVNRNPIGFKYKKF
ncbi:MAG TPA: hypothetical protein PLP73_01200 [Candidatus Absconditabacterales bacterium]|nr:hypothetical protein [Candidatus Absconditabacterales bacterium]